MTPLKRGSLLLAGTAGAFLTVLGAASQASAASYAVVSTVNMRTGPGTSYSIVKEIKQGTNVTLVCQTPGQTITGPLGTSSIWDKLADGGYISDTYLRTGSDGYVAPRCSGSGS
ncbi:hypothetical protein [Streptomyces sp. RG80]|uniref:hypothetical protein n=1 Tax=Streptomyces sp. RG80 TaxID=3157340 RepID=UPI00338F2FA2